LREGLTNGQIYEFKVRAANEVGSDSAYSDPAPLRAAVAPNAPGTPVKTFADKTAITIGWTVPTDDGGAPISAYLVFMDDGASGAFVSLGTVTGLTYAATGLTTGGGYLFKVSAINEIDSGPTQPSAKIFAAIVPSKPDAPILVSQSETSITTSWLIPSDEGGTLIIGYKVQWNGGSGSTFSTIHTQIDLSSLSFTKSDNIQAGKTYEFRIIASNAVGDSDPSDSTAILAAAVPG
jgi:titin